MIVIRTIYLEMKDVPDDQLEEKLKQYILCYDNMCHLGKSSLNGLYILNNLKKDPLRKKK